jgi:uncharacterized protein YndB with AHSA1/START domain
MSAGLISDELGRVIPVPGRGYAVVFERRIAKPVEALWAALTVPARIADWLAEAEVDLRVGGRFALYWPTHDFRMEGTIVELEPPRRIAWTWPHSDHPASVVRWTLEPDGAGRRLRLEQDGLAMPHLLEVAAGWHTHMEGLPGAADAIFTAWSAEREAVLVAQYRERLAALSRS